MKTATKTIHAMKGGARVFSSFLGFYGYDKEGKHFDINAHSSRSLVRRRLIKKLPKDPKASGTEWVISTP